MPRFAGVVLVMLAGLTPGVSRAGSTICSFEGTGPGIQVDRVDLPLGGGAMSLEVGGQRPIYPFVDRSNYYGSDGVIIMNALGRIEAFNIQGAWGQPPRVVISSGESTRVVDVTGVGPAAGLGWYQSYLPDGLAEGTHYVIGFGVGGFNYQGLVIIGGPPSTCVKQTIDAQQIHFDNTDFVGGNQQYLPYVGGSATNAKLSFTNPRDFFAGYIVAGGDGVQNLHLSYNTPAPGPAGRIDQAGNVGATWAQGTAQFGLSYQGTAPIVSIDGWAFSLR
jgi:hypothetical protein